MAAGNNGVQQGNSNGTTKQSKTSERTPRRFVRLKGDEQSEIEEVLLELRGEEVTGKRLHAEIQLQAAAHPGKWVAAEWLGNLGWTRFLWCKK
jgi:hypothetical protein